MGVDFLHRHNILHRDLKAKNIFLFHDGRAVIGDFGTSKTLASATGLGSTLVGSPLYMSPEIMENEPHSFATDVWSLGCILYELLSWRSPFAAPSYPAVVLRITQGTYEPLESGITSDTQALVAQMLQRDQYARPKIRDLISLEAVQQAIRDCNFVQISPTPAEDSPQVVDASALLAAAPDHPPDPTVMAEPVMVAVQEPTMPPPAPSAPPNTQAATSTSSSPPLTHSHGIPAHASAVAVLPTPRARIAHVRGAVCADPLLHIRLPNSFALAQVVSSQRLHLHRQHKQEQQQERALEKKKRLVHSSTAPIYHVRSPQPTIFASDAIQYRLTPTPA